ncbi:hypothetical protein RI367_001924 [Sorochytrium milnesiophthora]
MQQASGRKWVGKQADKHPRVAPSPSLAGHPTSMDVDFLQGNQQLEDCALFQKPDILTVLCRWCHQPANHTHDNELLKKAQAWFNNYIWALRGGTSMPVPYMAPQGQWTTEGWAAFAPTQLSVAETIDVPDDDDSNVAASLADTSGGSREPSLKQMDVDYQAQSQYPSKRSPF